MAEGRRLEHAEAGYLAAHLQELLARDPRVSAPELRVTLDDDGVATVTGVVTTDERRAAVARVIGDARPDLRVRNDTTLLDLSGPSSQERVS